ncbi:MAG: amidohydrolase [Thermoanaerobaculum sp.]|nr:amidohydrolase [Thermoanaerobaculum sp.]MDW7967567.1 amidohydrolase [Thermoanaerobaculum sp.]
MSFLCLSCTPPAPVDRLFVGGIVHLPDRPPQQREVAVADGRIVALVAPEEAPSWRRRAREVVPIPQAHVYPGFTESHGHLTGFGAALETVDLTGAGSYQEVIQRLAAKAHQLPPGSWVLGRGWDQNLWEGKAFPHHRELSQAIPHHPVLARRVDGHALLVNEHALQLAGITAQTPDPPGGQILRDAQGQPTGVLVDAAGDLVERVLPQPSVEELQRRQLAAAHRLASFGITSIHDAGTTARELEALRLLAGLGQLPIRVYVMLDGSDEQLLAQELARGVQTAPDGMLTVRAVKLYADGALGSRGAWLSQPYEDAPGQVGLSLTPLQRLRDVVARAAAAGFQPCIHAIGDEAVHQVLNLYEELLAGRAASLRPRVEHAQVVRPEDVPRFAQLQVIASVQPTHCTSDMPWAPERLGPSRIAWAYRWRSLVDAGARLCLGSDVPVEHPDPRLGIWAAVTRKTPQGHPPQGWNPAERLTLGEAVAGFTQWAAYAAFEETVRGRIAPGMWADLTIFDRPLEEGNALSAQLLRTVVGGKDVFVARGGP